LDASEPRNLAPDLPPRLKHKLRWRINRLRCMSPAEIVHRAARALQARAERSGLKRERALPVPDLGSFACDWICSSPTVDPAPYVAAADRIAEGWLDVFALRNLNLGSPPRWNRDPKTGIVAPPQFGKLLDYRDPDLVGDIKYLWEPNRHSHLVTLAQAYALTRDKKYFETIAQHLESWFLSCPYGIGPNWSSALEAALRLINWSIAWQLLGGANATVFQEQSGKDFRARWLRSVYQHAQFIGGWFSQHSSANNRLIGEAAGLYIAALTWPHWTRSQEWLASAQAILEAESIAQNAPDGVNREQSVGCQQFVLDLLLACLLAGKANGLGFPAAFEARIEAMLDFLASIMDAGGNVPMLGDADDGRATNLSLEKSPYRSLLATGALLFRRGDFKLKAGALDDKARWLCGPDADARWRALDADNTRLPPRQSFPDGGYYVLGCEFGTRSEIRLVADAGPLGYTSIAAHGHADALSFTLSAAGHEFLIDPGTYALHTQERWRQYFRGTAAHNTVRVDRLDQSVPGGSFMWLRKARAGCSVWLSCAEKDTFEGWHDGYLGLEDPVKHRRLIELDKSTRCLAIEDTLEMEEEHELELLFHCHDACDVDPISGGYLLSRNGSTVRLLLPSGGESAVYRGSLSPLWGWVSRALDQRSAAPTIVWRASLSGRTVLRTQISVGA
jgi:hypothetical protein